MVRQRLTTFAFYRYRYAIAYTAFGVALAVMLLIAGFYLPGGLTPTEMRSTIISDSINPAQLFSLPPDQLVYLPYRLLQAASISIFGVTVLSIKLPSIVLGFASAIGLLYLLNIWYRRNVAIVVAIISVTTSQFLLASQAGRAGITYIFLTTLVLISASMIARQSTYAKVWTVIGFGVAAISLYMPLNIYMLLALLVTAIIHPHARYVVFRKSSKVAVAIGSILGLTLATPLILGIIQSPAVLLRLLGIPENINEAFSGISEVLQNYAFFHAPTAGDSITPIYGLGLVALIAVGAYRLFTTKYTARSYLISFWLLALIPLVILNPDFISITFVPVMLIVALGVDYLISAWYRLFPQNPYARVFGLAPLAIFVVGLVFSNIDQYAYGLHYDKAVHAAYSYDLPLLDKKLKQLDSSTNVTLIVSEERKAFYQVFARQQNHLTTLTVTSSTTSLPANTLIIAERAFASKFEKIPTEILVTRTSTDANRFHLYKNDNS